MTQTEGQEGWDVDIHGRMIDAATDDIIDTEPYNPAKDPLHKGEVAYGDPRE